MSDRKCSFCKESVCRENNGFQCAGPCKKKFHPSCGGVTKNLLEFKDVKGFSIKCSRCVTSGSSSDGNSKEDVICKKLDSIHSDISLMKEQQTQFVASLQHFNEVIEDFRSEMSVLKNKIKSFNNIECELSTLKKDYNNLKEEMNELQQYSRRDNVEILGIPENKNENVVNILADIGTHVGCPVLPTDLAAQHRVAHQSPDNKRPRAIIAKFVSRQKKDAFIGACRKSNRFTCKDIGINNSESQIFVNDHLTFNNKELLRKAREACRTKGYAHCWIKDCRILVRKTDISRVIHICNESSVQKIN